MSALEADPLTLIILKAPANEEITGALIGLQDNKRTITVKNASKQTKQKTKTRENKKKKKIVKSKKKNDPQR